MAQSPPYDINMGVHGGKKMNNEERTRARASALKRLRLNPVISHIRLITSMKKWQRRTVLNGITKREDG